MGSGTGTHQPLGEWLAERRRRLFVGRSAELELMRTALDAAEPTFSVLYIHGPGGIVSAHPRDDKLLRAVDRTYLRPAATQESAAAMLGLPFSTYRRHLAQGVTRIVAWLWDREVYGQP